MGRTEREEEGGERDNVCVKDRERESKRERERVGVGEKEGEGDTGGKERKRS